MKNMGATDFIVALEFSSTTISGAVAKRNNDESLQVLAFAEENSEAFVRKGVIYNIDKAAKAIKSIVNKLEVQGNFSIDKVYVGIGGQSIHSILRSEKLEQDEEEIITEELVASINSENKKVNFQGLDVLEVVPQEYNIDDVLQHEAVGVSGKCIIANFLNIVAKAAVKRNLESSFAQAGVEIIGIIVAPLVLANELLSPVEKKSGCALVDMGAETTTVVIFRNGLLRYVNVLPIGGNTITQDLTTLKLDDETAENFKIEVGCTTAEEGMQHQIELPKQLTIEQIEDVILARQEEIFANVFELIKRSKYGNKIGGGVILTGGASKMRSCTKIWTKISKSDDVKVCNNIRIKINGFDDQRESDKNYNSLLTILDNCKEVSYIPEQAQPQEEQQEIAPTIDNTEEQNSEEISNSEQPTPNVETQPIVEEPAKETETSHTTGTNKNNDTLFDPDEYLVKNKEEVQQSKRKDRKDRKSRENRSSSFEKVSRFVSSIADQLFNESKEDDE